MMKFIISSFDLLKSLQVLGTILNTNNTLPILDNFLFELENNELNITSSDLETSLSTKLSIQSEITVKIAIPAKLLTDIISLHPKIELKTAHARSILKKTVPLNKAIQQWGNLAAFVSALYTDNYSLLSRCMIDEIIEPYRSMLIPEFDAIRSSAINAGALGSGISGSGPSIFALSQGEEKAKNIAKAMAKIISNLPIEHEVFISKINTEGIRILNQQ